MFQSQHVSPIELQPRLCSISYMRMNKAVSLAKAYMTMSGKTGHHENPTHDEMHTQNKL